FLPKRVDHFDDAQLDLMTSMTVRSGRPLNWNILRISAKNAAEVEHVLGVGAYARERGGKIVALNMPIPSRARFSFKSGFVLDALPEWKKVLSLPLGERSEALREPAVRRVLKDDVARATGPLAENFEFANRVITETFTDAAKPYEGRSVADIARDEGKDA